MRRTQNFTSTPVDRRTLKVLYTPHRHSIRESHVRCRDDNPTFPKLLVVFLVTEAMAVVIRSLNYSKDCGRVWKHILSFT
jgi:hypothetical protein